MSRVSLLVLFSSLMLVTGCASSRGAVDESARLVGRQDDVRIDARIANRDVRLGSNVSIRYDVENLRPAPIAIADIVPEVTFDAQTGIITILLGSEVPGNQFLPRLEMLRSGEVRSFATAVNLNVGSTVRAAPRAVRIRLSYLKDVEPFESLIEIDQKGVYDPELADEMFLPWVESVRFVDTNEIPLQWSSRTDNGLSSRSRPSRSPF